MYALDSFISPVPGFHDDILIPSILVSPRPPGDESMSDPFTKAYASTIKTQAGKRKATANPIPSKKPRKPRGNLRARSKSMNPLPMLLLLLLHRVLDGRS
jgi:hypothetical protein